MLFTLLGRSDSFPSGNSVVQGTELTDEDIAAAKILIVDDEPVVLDSLRSLLEVELEVEPTTFESPEDALAHFEGHDVDIVISDFMMPRINGIELLRRARACKPDVPRVLLTGYADKESAIEAINEVRLYQYLEKPWESARLRATIIGALQQRHLLRLLTRTADELADAHEDLADLRGTMLRVFA